MRLLGRRLQGRSASRLEACATLLAGFSHGGVMTLSVLAILVFFSALASWAGRRVLSRVLAVAVLVLFLAIACGPVPGLLLDHLENPYALTPALHWQARNAIVLLTGSSTQFDDSVPLEPAARVDGRIIKAVTLYRDCSVVPDRQCTVLVSGGDSQHLGTAESTVYAAVLVQLGVSTRDIQTETRSMNTFENARFSRPLLQILDPQTLVLVTSGVHLRRSLLDFHHFGMRPLPVHGDLYDATFSILPLASNLATTDAALHEYGGVAQYHLYNVLGWNSPAVSGPLIPALAGAAASTSEQSLPP